MKASPAIGCIPLLILLASSPAFAAGTGITAARQAFEGAIYARTPDAMIQARADIERLSAKEPKSALLHYWLAYADWRLAPRLMEKKPQAQRFVKDGLQHADQAVKFDPKLAEAVALKASLLGISIQLEPGTMMSVGPEIEMTMQRALTMAPANPRVLLLDAMGTLHKPAFVGGGADRALVKLEKVQELFDAEAKAKEAGAPGLEPDWGRFESYAWAGRSAAELGDKAAARGFYEKALAIQPENGWVRHVLLPELERADSTATAAKKGGS
jgi:tetratricopeptide (TPR) repeat protein